MGRLRDSLTALSRTRFGHKKAALTVPCWEVRARLCYASFMTIGGLFRRWNTNRKLKRGRCLECKTQLRDDDPFNGVCSEACAVEYADGFAY